MEFLGIRMYDVDLTTGEKTKVEFIMEGMEDMETSSRRLLKDPLYPDDIYKVTPENKLQMLGTATSKLLLFEKRLFEEIRTGREKASKELVSLWHWMYFATLNLILFRWNR